MHVARYVQKIELNIEISSSKSTSNRVVLGPNQKLIIGPLFSAMLHCRPMILRFGTCCQTRLPEIDCRACCFDVLGKCIRRNQRTRVLDKLITLSREHGASILRSSNQMGEQKKGVAILYSEYRTYVSLTIISDAEMYFLSYTVLRAKFSGN